MPVALVLALGGFLLQSAPAGAVVGPKPPGRTPRDTSKPELVMDGVGPGQAVHGFIATKDNTFDPVKDGYPTSDPVNDPLWTPKDEGFAGIIYGKTPENKRYELYCIDIFTLTSPGIGYDLGTWDIANVPNVGYVARILEEYFPHVPGKPALANDNQKAAAVQAAIWFFSDRYVLSTSDPLHNEVVNIVDHIRGQPPLVQPPPPSLTITPAAKSSTRRFVGPFTVTTNHPPAKVTATGAAMYTNSAGRNPIPDGTMVPSGTDIWLLKNKGAATAVLQATSTAVVPSGNVYLYAGGNNGVNDAQKLILAKEAELTTTVDATVQFLPYGSLVVKKTIAGDGAGSQAQVVIHVECDDGVARRDFVISAGTPAGTTSRTYRHIAAGTTCTVIETSNGAVTGVDVVVTDDGQQVAIPEGGRESVQITDTYTRVTGPSSLLVTKTIAGPQAGSQGQVTIEVVCNGVPLSPFVIKGGIPAGSVSQTYPVPAGSTCTVSETQDGATSTVTATVSANDQTVTVPAGEVVPVNVMDVYERTPPVAPDLPTPTGTLRVTKTIAGPAAGQQGPIAILVACGGPLHAYAFLIPAGRHAGSVSRAFPDLPVGSRCTVTETANGQTSTIQARAANGRTTVTIVADSTATVHLTDSFSAVRAVSFTG